MNHISLLPSNKFLQQAKRKKKRREKSKKKSCKPNNRVHFVFVYAVRSFFIVCFVYIGPTRAIGFKVR